MLCSFVSFCFTKQKLQNASRVFVHVTAHWSRPVYYPCEVISSTSDYSPLGHVEKDTASGPILKWWGVICLCMPCTSPVEQTCWHYAKHFVQVKQLLGSSQVPISKATNNRKHNLVQHRVRTKLTPIHKGSQKTNSISSPHDQNAL